jgi:hypothetical protein
VRKNIVKDFVAISSGNMSASITGASTVVNQHDTLSYIFKWTGGNTLNGTIGVEASIDGITYFPLDFKTTINASGATDTHQLLISSIGFNYTRPIYTKVDAGASGSLTVELFCSNSGA